MSNGLIFDIESNGLLPDVTKIHCIAYRDEAGGSVKSVGGKTDEKIREFLTHLEASPLLIGHNIREYDIPALKKIYPAFNPKGERWDTLIDSQWMWTNIRDLDFNFSRKNPDFPKDLIGRHSLKAWGYRMGILKGVLAGDDLSKWEQWSEELEGYCRQDVVVTAAFLEKIKASPLFSPIAHDLEQEFKEYILDQEREGFPFDEAGAKSLYTELAAERAPIEEQLQVSFPPWEQHLDFIPKRNNKKRGYVKGVPYKKTKLITFNPRSHKHIAERLVTERGWKPEDFTDKGAPTTDSDVMEALAKEWPECAHLARHGEIQKIIGMVAEGQTAYLKLVTKAGRIHGRVKTNGAVTGRCSHVTPNLGNIPRRGDLGKRVRKLFTTIPGYSLVGCDAKGLELRMLAHFLARFDDGAYVLIVVDGDPHEYHRVLAELASRDDSKTFIYGFIYGAGDSKIGLIVGKGKAAGKALRLKFLRKFPALNKLKNAVAEKAKAAGFIKGLDGRRLHVRAIYSSLNTLLQSAGAIVMKQAVVLFNRKIREKGYFQQGIVRQVVMVHDEFQSLVKEGYEEEAKALAIASIKEAGEFFALRCPTDGDAKHGIDWGETH